MGSVISRRDGVLLMRKHFRQLPLPPLPPSLSVRTRDPKFNKWSFNLTHCRLSLFRAPDHFATHSALNALLLQSWSLWFATRSALNALLV